MEQEYASILKFNQYIVDEINFKNNNSFIKKDEKISIVFNIDKDIKKNDNNMEVKLITTIFKDAEKNNYPFEMNVVLTGYFTIENNEKDINFEPNAIAILFPYIRAVVSTYTASANVPPLILPAINVNKLIDDTKKKD